MALVRDDEIRELNRRYLNRNRPTDVLAFPLGEDEGAMGEVVVSVDTARREAREESGLALGALHKVADYYPSPGAVTEYLYSFVAEADELFRAQLDLPPGFSYRIISRAGERMSDGFFVPRAHDGMAAFSGDGGRGPLAGAGHRAEDEPA